MKYLSRVTRTLILAAFLFCLAIQPALAASGQLPPGIITKEEPKNFDERVKQINASPEFFKALAELPGRGPIINFNLIRFRPERNGELYSRYGAAVAPRVFALEGSLLHYGGMIQDIDPSFNITTKWDGIAYVVYPERTSYIELQKDPIYQDAIADRVAGTYERMLYVLSDGEGIYETESSITNYHNTQTHIEFKKDNIILSQFLRFKKPNGRSSYEKFAKEFAPMLHKIGGVVELSANAEMPIVSNEFWDHFVAFRFPSLEAFKQLYKSEEFKAIYAIAEEGLDGNFAVLSKPKKVPTKSKK
jgi:uncharacterized protein (DUF1330 family)